MVSLAFRTSSRVASNEKGKNTVEFNLQSPCLPSAATLGTHSTDCSLSTFNIITRISFQIKVVDGVFFERSVVIR